MMYLNADFGKIKERLKKDNLFLKLPEEEKEKIREEIILCIGVNK